MKKKKHYDSIEADLAWITWPIAQRVRPYKQINKPSNCIPQTTDIRNLFAEFGWGNRTSVFLQQRNVSLGIFFSFCVTFVAAIATVCAFHCSKVDMFRVLIKWKYLVKLFTHKLFSTQRQYAVYVLMIHLPFNFMCQI